MAIELRAVSKRFGRDTLAVHDLSLRLPGGKLVALLGPSGCGKSTTLRLIAGLEVPDTGEIWLEHTCVAGPHTWLPPEARRIGMVFQDYALFPHLTISENIAFPVAHLPPPQRRERVADLLQRVGLDPFAQRYPHQLSGGQQQRVALARALAPHPMVVLLDEPFSNLDATLRKSTREDVRHILATAGATTIFVTHDQEEAFSIADLVVVMSQGTMIQCGTPQEIYFQPATREIATFVGEANILNGQANGQLVTCVLGTLPLSTPVHGAVDVLIRPEALTLQPDPHGPGRIVKVSFFGNYQMAHICLVNGTHIQARIPPRRDLTPDTWVQVTVQGAVMAYHL